MIGCTSAPYVQQPAFAPRRRTRSTHQSIQGDSKAVWRDRHTARSFYRERRESDRQHGWSDRVFAGTLAQGGRGFCHPQVECQKAMSDDRTIITLPPNATHAIMDAVQRAIIDKGASKATRKAAFSALLALVDAGLIKGSLSANSPAREKTGVARTPAGARWLLTGPG
jgi:hypothetical protein